MPEQEPTKTSPTAKQGDVDKDAKEANLTVTEDHAVNADGKYSLTMKSKKRWMPKIAMSIPLALGLGVIGLTIVGVLFIWGRHDAPETSDPVAIVKNEQAKTMGLALTLVEGQAEISQVTEKISGAEFVELNNDSEITTGQFIRTGKESRVVLTLDDGSAIRLNSETTVNITQLLVDDIEITLGEGEVYTRVVKNTNREFSIITENNEFTAQGTAYKTVSNDEVEGVLAYESKVKTKDNVEVSEGEQYYDKNKNAKDSEGKVTDIDDDELSKDEFALWNRDQDLKDSSFKDALGILEGIEYEKTEKGQDTEKPTTGEVSEPLLTMIKPTSTEFETESIDVTFKGSVPAGTTVTINGAAQHLDEDNTFSDWIPVYTGVNKFTIIAKTSDGQTETKIYKITHVPSENKTESDAFTLSATTSDKGIAVSWTVKPGTVINDGMKIVYSTTPLPVYGNAPAVYVGSGMTGAIQVKDGKKYYIRVCSYSSNSGNGQCDRYSNQVEFTAPTE